MVAPASALIGVAPPSMFVGAAPGLTFANVVPASTFAGVMPASTFAGVTPASTFANVTPAAAPMSLFSLSNAAPLAPLLTPSSGTMGMNAAAAPLSAAAAQAASVGAAEAQAAEAGYPALAQAARTRGLDGGRFVVFLRNLLRGSIPELGGQGTAVARSILRQFLAGLIRSQLGFEPGTGGLGTEIENLIGDFLGGGTSGGAGNDQCVTIRVCVDSGKGTVIHDGSGGGSGGGGPVVSGDSKVPLLAPLRAGASGQALATNQARASNGNAEVPPPPVRPAEAPVLQTPPAPVPGVPPAAQEDTADPRAARHKEIMTTLNSINESLQKIAEKIK